MVLLTFISRLSVRNPISIATYGLACSPFARHYLGTRCYFIFLRLLRCFSSAGIPPYSYEFTIRWLRINTAGFPHSEICGSKVICTSPQLIAAYRVLLRLLMPRHPPCALISLTKLIILVIYFLARIIWVSLFCYCSIFFTFAILQNPTLN